MAMAEEPNQPVEGFEEVEEARVELDTERIWDVSGRFGVAATFARCIHHSLLR